MNVIMRNISPDSTARANRRAAWMRQLRTWHWISGAVSLAATLMFAITGITLNHSAQIESKALVSSKTAQLDQPLRTELAKGPSSGRSPVGNKVAAFIGRSLGASVAGRSAEWSASEVYISLPRPGGDAWVSIDRQTGDIEYEVTDRGWIAYLNDLHKGRNTGLAWSVFIDVFGVACAAFCITGLLLLQMYSAARRSIWPIVAVGIALPILLAMFLIH